jgi:hypothetical protein
MNSFFHVGWLQATFGTSHLVALARPWHIFLLAFPLPRRRGWVARHVAWRSLITATSHALDSGCGVAYTWCRLQPMLLALFAGLTNKERPGIMPRGEGGETSITAWHPCNRHLATRFKQRPGSLHPPRCVQDLEKANELTIRISKVGRISIKVWKL